MKDLHQLIDKWESRFLDTASETIDEKIEGLSKQVRRPHSPVGSDGRIHRLDTVVVLFNFTLAISAPSFSFHFFSATSALKPSGGSVGRSEVTFSVDLSVFEPLAFCSTYPTC